MESVELTVRQAAKSLGVRLGTVYQLLWDGTLTGQKDERGEWSITLESVEAYKLRRTVRRAASRSALRRGAIDVTTTAEVQVSKEVGGVSRSARN